jgi:membrane associated rhomboid family serine protease
VIPVKVKHLMILLGVFAFLGSIDSSGPGGISHVTHLGGLLAAFLWLKGGDILKRGRPGKRRSARVYQVPPNHPDFRA